MKIVSISFVAFVDGYGYQDNLLPEYLQQQGHDVTVLAAANHFPAYVTKQQIQTIKEKGEKYDLNGVHIRRLNVKWNTTNYNFICPSLYKTLEEIQPDMIFHHGVDLASLLPCIYYRKNHPSVVLYADNHADYLNESQNKFWKFLYIRGVLRFFTRCLSSSVDRFWGVTQLRCDYLHDVLGIPKKKIGFLPIGSDVNSVNKYHSIRPQLKERYGISESDFLIISGGKMGVSKGTVSLIQAFNELNLPNTKLLLFGKIDDNKTKHAVENTIGVTYMSWCNRQETLEVLQSADIAVWPIHHTTLIEDAVACSVPLLLRRTGNTQHLISGGNGIFIEYGTKEELIVALKEAYIRRVELKKNAISFKNTLSYQTVTKILVNDAIEILQSKCR